MFGVLTPSLRGRAGERLEGMGMGWGEASFTGTKIQKYFLNSKKRAVQMREHPLNSIHLTVK